MVCLSILFIATITVTVSATERVIPLPSPPAFLIFGHNGFTIGHTKHFDRDFRAALGIDPRADYVSAIDQAIKKSTFKVYTVEEIDQIRTADQKKIAELQDTVTFLRKNVKDLSEMNDALTERLDELEKKIRLMEVSD